MSVKSSHEECRTDLHILSVPPGIPATPGAILGHEVIGEVVEIGPDVKEIELGDRVAVAANLTCGLCRQCKAGRSLHCENWTTSRLMLLAVFEGAI